MILWEPLYGHDATRSASEPQRRIPHSPNQEATRRGRSGREHSPARPTELVESRPASSHRTRGRSIPALRQYNGRRLAIELDGELHCHTLPPMVQMNRFRYGDLRNDCSPAPSNGTLGVPNRTARSSRCAPMARTGGSLPASSGKTQARSQANRAPRLSKAYPHQRLFQVRNPTMVFAS